MPFHDRPPSNTWELIPCPPLGAGNFWAWFRPMSLPTGICVHFPQELWTQSASPLSMRMVAHALGLAPTEVLGWSLFGFAYDSQFGRSPAWEVPIGPPAAGVEPTLSIFMAPQLSSPAPPAAVFVGGQEPVGADSFSRMEADWNASLQLELQLDACAKQLNGTLLRLNALNRDLSPDEFRAADQQERREWQESRRWLRDVASRVSRFLKEQHVGMTSSAGKRGAYEAIFRDHVVPRRPLDGALQVEREFEAYRKTLQSLLNNMQAAQAAAVRDGESRAQQVLSRISARVRAARAKR